MEKFDPPRELSFETDNLSAAWKKWRKFFEFYLTAAEKDTKSDKIKISILMSCIGEKDREVYETFEFPPKANDGEPDPEMVLANVLAKFETYCTPRKNTTILRHKFFTYKQEDGQCFSDFVTHLKRLSQDCEFQTLRDSLVCYNYWHNRPQVA